MCLEKGIHAASYILWQNILDTQVNVSYTANSEKRVLININQSIIIGQYVETPEDAVFTVETSVRTAMQAVHALTNVDKDPIEVAPTFYDMRCVLALVKKFADVDKLSVKDLPKINPRQLKTYQQQLVDFLNNNIEPMPKLYPGRDKKY